MNFRVSLPGTAILVFVLTTGASAQKGIIITPVAPSDSSWTSQGGLLVHVGGNDRSVLDRQAVVRAVEKDSQKIQWQTTGRDSEATLGDLHAGTYEIEVSAVGYLTSSLEVKIPDPNQLYRVHVNLTKDPAAIELSVSDKQPLPAKARKELSQGIAELKSGKNKQAEKHLSAVNVLAPNNSEVKFLLGYAAFQEKDFKQSEALLIEATSLDPQNVQALTLLGRLQIQRQDYSVARKTLEQAVNADANSWMAHNLLAETDLKLQEYEKAREQAQLAIDRGRGAANSAQIALGQALENLGQNQQALQAYRAFLKGSPSSPMAAQVRTMFDDLHRRMSSPEGNPANTKKASYSPADALLAASVPGLSTKAWGPPGIDDVKPPVAEGIACPYDEVIDGVGERIKELVDDVGRFNAIEDLVHEDLDALDHPISRTVLKFNYVASIEESKPGVFTVGEFRDRRSGPDDLPDQIATRGLPALALIFHPDERDDFQMSCEGLGDWRGQATWLIRFQQREDRPRRVQDYRIAGHSYPVNLKGRAWISANTFHLLHLESDLISPMPEIQLMSEHLAVDYAPQSFQKNSLQLWLPKNAEIYFDFRRHHYLRRHSFDHFMLFSVDSQEKRTEPRASKEPLARPAGAPQTP